MRERFRLTRLALQLSQGDVARRAGIARSYISMVENGYSPVSAKLRARLAAALGVDVGWLFEEDRDAE